MSYEDYDIILNNNLKDKKNLIDLCNFISQEIGTNFEELKIKNNISHKIIEIFMILTNYYGGNYLYKKGKKILVRTQNKFIPTNIIIPEYVKTFFNIGAIYKIIKNGDKDDYFHHSLGLKNYSHLTSPMRRAVDMINHLFLHNVDEKKEINDKLEKIIDIEIINLKLKNYKKLSNAYQIIKYLEITNKFRAFVFNISKSNSMLLIITTHTNDFKKIIKVKIPLEYINKIKQFDEIDIQLFYDSYKFKSKLLPFSIKIL